MDDINQFGVGRIETDVRRHVLEISCLLQQPNGIFTVSSASLSNSKMHLSALTGLLEMRKRNNSLSKECVFRKRVAKKFNDDLLESTARPDPDRLSFPIL